MCLWARAHARLYQIEFDMNEQTKRARPRCLWRPARVDSNNNEVQYGAFGRLHEAYNEVCLY